MLWTTILLIMERLFQCAGTLHLIFGTFSRRQLPMTSLFHDATSSWRESWGIGEWQQDFALRRQFNLTEKVGMQFRAEAFNIFNHPNFGAIQTTLTAANFGQATNMLNRQLGGLNQLYQIGGPRSLQFALKLRF